MDKPLKNPKPKLLINWATHKAAEYAVKNWHYSQSMPAGKTVKIGAWENDQFIGVIIYSYGANNNAPKSFGLKQSEVCELTRVALRNHTTPVTRILAIAFKMLKKANPGLKLVFSYADLTNQGHQGVIYQADNWSYLGTRTTAAKGAYYIINGKKMHGRSARAKYGSEKSFPKGWSHCPPETKHLYVKVIDQNYELKFDVKPYPKRAVSKENVASEFHSEEGGANPTTALQLKESHG